MSQMGIRARVILVLTMAFASVLLALFIMVNRAESHNVESASVISGQLALLRQQLVGPDQATQGQTGGHANHGSHQSPAAAPVMPGMDGLSTDMSKESLETYLGQLAALQEQQHVTFMQGSREVLVTAVMSCAIVALLIWLFLGQQLVRPLGQLASVARRLQSNDTEMDIPHVNRVGEVGVLASALDSFRAQCLSVQALQQSVDSSQEKRDREGHDHTQREQERERSQARVHELEEALEHAQMSVASEAALKQRVQQLSDAISAASNGNLNELAKRLAREQRADDSLGRMVIDLGKLFAQFDRDLVSINTGAGQLVESAANLQGLGESIINGAKSNEEKTRNILAGAQGVRDVLLQVSSNVEQMESGIQGISNNASQASVVATQAVELAQSTDGTMRKLADSSVDINNVIKLITSIAEQTNLLALNATIEAARAGDAGKGFAVVANEVKELAKETNKATDEIQRRITAIRTETGHAVEAIGNINQIVSQIDGLQGNISESVRDQSSAVQTILSLIGNASEDNAMVRQVLIEVLERQHLAQGAAAEVQRSSEVLRTGAEGNLQITRRYAS